MSAVPIPLLIDTDLGIVTSLGTLTRSLCQPEGASRVSALRGPPFFLASPGIIDVTVQIVGERLRRTDEELEDCEPGILETGWFLVLLAGLAVLMVAFIALPYLVDWSPTRPGSPGVATMPSAPLRPSPATTSPAPQTAQAVTSPVVPPAKQTANVTAEALNAASNSPVSPGPRPTEPRIHKTAAPILSNGEFWVQVGAFRSSKDAARLAAGLTAEQYPAMVRRGASPAGRYVIWVGRYPNRKRAEEVRAALARKGLRGFILTDKGR